MACNMNTYMTMHDSSVLCVCCGVVVMKKVMNEREKQENIEVFSFSRELCDDAIILKFCIQQSGERRVVSSTPT